LRPRAITGLGVVSTVGIGREGFVRAMQAPVALDTFKSGPLESLDPATYPDAAVAEVRNFDPARYLGDKGLRTLDRLTKLLVVAARLAMHDAGFKKDGVYVQSRPERVGICCSNAYGSLEAITELDRVAVLEDARYINPAKFPNTVANSASGYASIWEDMRALNVAVSDGNCGALDAVACADIFLDGGRADALLVGGVEAMSEALYLAFLRLGALSGTGDGTSAAKPRRGLHLDGTSAAKPRRGLHLGEGAALLAMEPLELAKKRGARRLADVCGYGTAFLAPEHDGSLIHPSTEAMERALTSAIADAGLSPKDVDLVASGISGLRAFDDAELSAIERVLGNETPVATPKAVLGETLGAGGSLAMAAALAWLGGTPPAPLARGRAGRPVRTVAVTSMGFYGNASAVVMQAPQP
jgi:3-oxoacyl-[acyl-carrier-protein] synthase II